MEPQIIAANKSKAAGANADRIEKSMHQEVSAAAKEAKSRRSKECWSYRGRIPTSGNLN